MNSKVSRYYIQKIIASRGQGRGQGGPRQRDGGPACCICPSCGQVLPHDYGIPCTSKVCPSCGVVLRGASTTSQDSESPIKRIIARFQNHCHEI